MTEVRINLGDREIGSLTESGRISLRTANKCCLENIDVVLDADNYDIDQGVIYEECTEKNNELYPVSASVIGALVQRQFASQPELVSVDWSDSNVTRIPYGCFQGCSNLAEAYIPDGVTSIGAHAFNSCEKIKSVIIPESCTELGIQSFGFCNDLENVEIHSQLTRIPDYCFTRCDKLVIDSLPDTVEEIGISAFYRESASSDYHGFAVATLPSALRRIGTNAFQNQVNWELQSLPSGLEVIGSVAFYRCSHLQITSFPNSITSIGQSAFLGTLATSVADPTTHPMAQCIHAPINLTTLGAYAFNMSAVAFHELPDGVTRIEQYTFAQAPNVTMEDGMGQYTTYIGDYAFFNCSRCVLPSLPLTLVHIGRAAFDGTGITVSSIPDSVTELESSAFYNCSSITTMTIGSGVTQLKGHVFGNCNNLANVVIGNHVTTIDPYAFSGCPSLRYVVFTATPTSVDSTAFQEVSGATEHATFYFPWSDSAGVDESFVPINSTKIYNYVYDPSNTPWN